MRTASRTGEHSVATPPPKQIAHLDLDCFFVSVERIKNPALNGIPVIVGGSPTMRGVVASASYEARAYGVRSAMPAAQALRLCPQLTIVSGHHREYSRISNRLYDRMLELAPIVERASIDELYLDVTGCESLYGNNLPGFMKTLQTIVWEEFHLPCTIALATNKTVAKIATGTVKPRGVCVVSPGTEKDFLAPLSIDVIPGVGKKTGDILRRKGIQTISDLQACSRESLIKLLGVHGGWLFRVASGQGNDVVLEEYDRKSISREETFSRDIHQQESMERILFELVEDVCSTLRARQWKAQTVTLKLRYADFKTITRAETIEPTDDDPQIFKTVRGLFKRAYDGRKKVRLLGVKLSELSPEEQLDLGLDPLADRRKQILLAVEKIRKKFGDDSIHVGSA